MMHAGIQIFGQYNTGRKWRTSEKAHPSTQTSAEKHPNAIARRSLLLCGIAAVSGAVGLAGALAMQAIRYVLGPRLDSAQQTVLLARKQELLAAQERLGQMELGGINSQRIAVAKLDELVEERGQLFTDYFLQPAILYRTGENTCIARSAVCTHLGCTVQTDLVDGKIYCPCHVSYFDLQTGQPLVG